MVKLGKARQGIVARLGTTWHGLAGRGGARCGRAGCGDARLGSAWPG
jgi:hypothetical protein